MAEDMILAPEEDEPGKQVEIEKRATVAGPDTEEQLRILQNLQASIRVPAATKRRYENLRNRLTRQLSDEGARWFLDDHGEKWLGYVVTPEYTVLDVDEALRMVEEDELDPEVLEQIAPRQASLEGVREALVREDGKKLTPYQIAKLLSFEKRTRHIKYVRPLEERDAGQ
ncbi:MAG TPA: hypothetical protein VIT65_23225 [Microlunatus sp.]